MNKFLIDDEHSGARIDVFIANQFPQYSRSALNKLFENGDITLNGKSGKPGLKIRTGNEVSIDLSELQKVPDVIEIPIIFEDDNVIVVNKPVGMISHARGKFWDEASVASFIRARVNINGDAQRAGIVHRLDRATSGVMVCAKNPVALKWLQQQFSERKVKKSYQAIIKKGLTPEAAIIDMPIGRNPKKPSSFRVDPIGKPAVTEYHTVKQTDHYQQLQLTPQTGRTHQLRVHLKHLGYPIVGDELYGGEPADRLFLHAESLDIAMPISGEIKNFSAELPSEFNDKLKS